MPEAPSQRLDVGRLADAHADIEFAIPLAEFPRLCPYLASAGDPARGHVRFGRDGGFAVADVQVDATVPLTCQRCLEPMQWPVAGEAKVALVSAEAQADRVPQEYEPVLAADGRITLRELVEEELLLSLPIVPLHGEGTACAAGRDRDQPDTEPESSETQRPFEQLGELLRRNKQP